LSIFVWTKRRLKKEEVIQFWLESSDKDFHTMLHLYVHKKDESYAMIHNLLRIAEKAGLDLNDEQQLFFSTVTGFNINARYDDFKQSFYQKCTQEYTVIWIEKIKAERSWIKNQLLK
jgi:hypothetical protein